MVKVVAKHSLKTSKITFEFFFFLGGFSKLVGVIVNAVAKHKMNGRECERVVNKSNSK